MGDKIIFRPQLHFFLASVLSFLLLFSPSGCGNGNQDTSSESSSETGYVSLQIHWHDTLKSPNARMNIKAATLDCQGAGVENIACEVYNTDNSWLLTGGLWPCMTGSGETDGIPSGADRFFVILAEDDSNNIRYQGQTAEVTIVPDQVTEITIDAYPFIPTLSAPQNSAALDPNGFSLEWQDLQNAAEYLVQVAEESNFENPVVNETTAGTSFVPSTLAPTTEYFWRIQAVDQFTNIGAASEIRNFTTSDCTYAISPTDSTMGPESGAGSFNITPAAADCEWIASTEAVWIQITPPAEGIGDGVVNYSVAANPTIERTGTITVGGQTHTITQQGLGCTYQILPADGTFAQIGGTGTVEITASGANCPWNATTEADWIQITAPAQGIGNGSIGYTVTANPTAIERVGTILIAGISHTVTQSGGAATCTYQISPASAAFTAQGGNGEFQVSTSAADCAWNAAANVDWIVITSGTAGSGNGSVAYTVEPNATSAARTGIITVGGQQHTVTQDFTPLPACTYTLDPINASVGSGEVTYSIAVGTSRDDCQWTATTTADWITLAPVSGSGNGNVNVTVAPNATGQDRSAQITIAGSTHTVSQDAAPTAP